MATGVGWPVIGDGLLDTFAGEGPELRGEGGGEADRGEVIRVGRGHGQPLRMRPQATIDRLGVPEGGHQHGAQVRDEGKLLDGEPTAVIEESGGDAVMHREELVELDAHGVTRPSVHGGENLAEQPSGDVRPVETSGHFASIVV